MDEYGEVTEINSYDNPKSDSIVLKKDLVIKAGTVLNTAPNKITLVGDTHYETIIGLSDDSSGAFRYCISDMDNFDEWFEKVEE